MKAFLFLFLNLLQQMLPYAWKKTEELANVFLNQEQSLKQD